MSYILSLPVPPSAALQSQQLRPTLPFCADTFPTPSSLCPLSQLPGGRVALVAPSWLGISAHFVPFPCRGACATCPRSQLGHLRAPGATQAGRRAGPAAWSAQASGDTERHRASPGRGFHVGFGFWGILPRMPTRNSACGARQGRGGSTPLDHPPPLPTGMSPPICTV